MSQVYNLEPPTQGKVVLKTTKGDIDIELWAKEAPLAVRNFVQLCLEGYYDGTIFHRSVKDFMIQGGDPTGSGNTVESIYGKAFKDEFHSRIRFNHRGQVACANENVPHSNGSQFFITLERAEWLDRKNTIFGRVAGDTIYNVVEMNNLEVDDSDRPLEPPVILETEVLWNPFEDIVPRTTREQRAAEAAAAQQAAARTAGGKKKKIKDLKLLSFGEEAEEEDQELAAAAPAAKVRSAHDVLVDRRFVREDDEAAAGLRAEADAELTRVRAALRAAPSAQAAEDDEEADAASAAERDQDGAGAPDEGDDGEAGFDARMRAKVQARRRALGDTGPTPAAVAEEGGEEGSEKDRAKAEGRERQRQELQSVRQKREEANRASNAKPAIQRPKKQLSAEDRELLTAWQAKRKEALARKRTGGAREADSLARLARFRAQLHSAPPAGAASASSAPAEDSAAAAGPSSTADGEDTGYDGRVRTDVDHRSTLPAAWRVDSYLDDEDDVDTGGLAALRGHKFVFTEDKSRRDAMARDMQADHYVVVDPLAQKDDAAGVVRKLKKGRTEWSGRAMA